MKIKLSGSNIEEAQEVIASQSGIRAFSKVVELGNDYRLFIPVDPKTIDTDRPAIMSASFPVRTTDRFVKGSTYILEDWDADEMTGRYIDKTAVAPYEGISRVIHKAECKKAKAKKERDMRADAKENDVDTNSPEFISKLAIELNNVDILYNGTAKDVKPKVYAENKPLIGPVHTYTCTEFYVVPVVNGVPNFAKAEIAAYDISSSAKLTKLQNAFKSAYVKGDAFVELHIQYGYNAKKASDAGLNLAFEAVKTEDRLSVKTPEKFEEFKPNLERIAKSAEQIAARSSAARYNSTADILVAAFKDYISRTPGLFSYIDMEDNATKYAAQDLLDSGIVQNATVQEGLLKLVAETNKADADAAKLAAEAENAEDFNAAKVSKATNLDELEEAVRTTSSTGDTSALDSDDMSVDMI